MNQLFYYPGGKLELPEQASQNIRAQFKIAEECYSLASDRQEIAAKSLRQTIDLFYSALTKNKDTIINRTQLRNYVNGIYLLNDPDYYNHIRQESPAALSGGIALLGVAGKIAEIYQIDQSQPSAVTAEIVQFPR